MCIDVECLMHILKHKFYILGGFLKANIVKTFQVH